jgi:hypothetical protein
MAILQLKEAIIMKENVKFTTPTQQPHNNPSHESGPNILGSGPLSCEGLLCGYCDGVVYESNPISNKNFCNTHLVGQKIFVPS